MLTCLITRPKHQAAHLAQLIQQAGGQAILFPTLEILSLPINLPEIQSALEKADKIIFTSANAVTSIALLLSAYKTIPIIAVGPGTQNALKPYGIEAIIPKAPEFNSEGLLTLAELSAIQDQQIVIFKGEDGRTLLQDTLQARGVNVIPISTYRRVKPNSDLSDLIEKNIDWIISTSQESLKNLWEIAGETHQPWLKQQHLLVISPAIKIYAEKLGFLHPALVSSNASDEAILKTLLAKLSEKLQIPQTPKKQ